MKIFLIIFFFLLRSLLPIYTQQEQKNKYIDFELILLNSTEPIKLSNIVGKKIILLIFWTTWCPFCINEVPEVINLHETYKDKGLEIISINISEPQKIVSEFVKKKNIQYKVALDLNAEVAKRYYIRKIPTNFMIDINGKIVFKGHILPSKEEIEKYLSQLYPKKTGNVSTKKKQKKQKSKK